MPNSIQPNASTRAAVTLDGLLYILRNPNGNRYFLYLYRKDAGQWNWNYNWLDNDRNARNPALVFATLFISPRLAGWLRRGVLFTL
jgi:hypothetical protein